MPGWLRLLPLLGLGILSGCAAFGVGGDVQRATEGPTAEEVFMARFVRGYARVPTFDETATFRDDLEQRLSDYLSKRPELSTSPRASQFRFHRRVAIGMTKEEVALLVGPPDWTTRDEPRMREVARHFWPAIRERAREMWAYPGGWQLYFDGDLVVDVTVIGKPPL